MKYVFIVTLKTEANNLQISDCSLNNWRYSWIGNQITAITQESDRVIQNISSPYDELQTAKKLGLLVDTLSFCSDLPVSTKIKYRLYEVQIKNKININNPHISFNDLLSQVKNQKQLQNGDSSDDWPTRVHSDSFHTFNSDKIQLIQYLLKYFSNIKFNNAKLKLLNYWRRSFDLNELTYGEESFLACYKILEYFEGLYSKGKDKIIDKRIKLVKTKTKRKALRIGVGVGLSKIDSFLVRLLSETINARNNFDIAHMRIRPLPESRDGNLYFTYNNELWDLHDDLIELTRFFILKYLKIGGIGLKADGGLLRLFKI